MNRSGVDWERLLHDRINAAFELHHALADALDDDALRSKLPGIASNTVGEQFWCVVGARESYARAIASGEWAGFSCSLNVTTSVTEVRAALRRSAEAVRSTLAEAEPLTETSAEFALLLLEHEAAHHGQLIRYIYALRLPIPDLWKTRYALTDHPGPPRTP